MSMAADFQFATIGAGNGMIADVRSAATITLMFATITTRMRGGTG